MKNELQSKVNRLLLPGLVVMMASVWSGMTLAEGGVLGGVMSPGDANRGATSWANNCARCHEMRSPTEFRDDIWKPIVTHMRVRAGLTGQQQRDVLAFLQASNHPQSTRVSLQEDTPGTGLSGKDIYNQTCIACHGANGKGAIPGTPDFTRASGALSKSDDELVQNITSGFQSPGSPMAMPAKGGNQELNATDVRAVLGYLRESFSQ